MTLTTKRPSTAARPAPVRISEGKARINFDVSKEEHRAIKRAAVDAGQSMADFILDAVRSRMER